MKSKLFKKGHHFSEISHYTYEGPCTQHIGNVSLIHRQGGKRVSLSPQYIEQFCHTGNQWENEVEVNRVDTFWKQSQIDAIDWTGKEKPSAGDLRAEGIRTIFENIPNKTVFTVIFQKKGKDLSRRAVNKLKKERLEELEAILTKTARHKEGVKDKAIELVSKYLDDPIKTHEEGEMRTLVGYKEQFSSKDGYYQCYDMNLREAPFTRPVNIRTIKELIYKGTRYVVKN